MGARLQVASADNQKEHLAFLLGSALSHRGFSLRALSAHVRASDVQDEEYELVTDAALQMRRAVAVAIADLRQKVRQGRSWRCCACLRSGQLLSTYSAWAAQVGARAWTSVDGDGLDRLDTVDDDDVPALGKHVGV